jgi:hypothetical protein
MASGRIVCQITLRERMGRKISPLVAVFESQSLEATKKERQSRQSGRLTPALSSRSAHGRKAMREEMSRERLVTPARSGAGAPDRVRVS